MLNSASRGGKGFTAVELAAAIAATAILICVLALASADHRRNARLGDDLAKLKTLGAGFSQFGADNADQFATFTWVHGQSYQTQYPELNNAPSDIQAAANQLVYVLRTRGNRPDMPVIQSFVPHLNYTTVVLADYLDQRLPWLGAVSSADVNRLKWALDPACFDSGCFVPCQPEPSVTSNRRWPYSSSFSAPFAFFDLSPVGSRLEFSGTTGAILVYATAVLGPQHLSNVSFPSHKVLLHDRNAWHFGSRQPYCTHPQARLPLLLADASVSIRSAADGNLGWQPNNPSIPSGNFVTYSPQCWEPPALSASDGVFGRFRLTRNGVFGRDFGGPEVN